MKSEKSNLIAFLVIFVLFVGVIAVLVFTLGKDNKPSATNNTDSSQLACNSVSYTKTNDDPIAKVSTSKGCIVLELYKKDAPKTVDNFIGLAEQGKYDNLLFHRVLPNFVIQTGDPKGDGTGGTSIYGSKFEDELNQNTDSYKTGYVKGTLAMANSGPNTNGSQFFITVGDLSNSLPKNYTIFGKVVLGQDVADQISQVETKDPGTGEKSTPVTPVYMNKVEVIK